ncbi:AzlC family ABC transporter permease [Entomomonas asaccharolytica]|uniref:AzlC family ABC transporter permease n=1 Tax=Entomomonas asaccharolytica TaxID=2785331 RepID=A0A974NI78_9GAMM|nr:AzlC family ABC transporter permease [Entomomonas asaccharolytica]QQP86964.1 AzlC family ABC transporter permease [Entomomonas asaccharolytica]
MVSRFLSTHKEFIRGLVAAIPIMISFIPFSLVLGAQAIQRGMATGEISLMVAMNFAGGSEFVAVNLWTSPPHLLLLAFMTLLVNSRHILMGAALTPYLQGLPKKKVLLALFFMCDESWAMSFADAKKSTNQRFNYHYYIGASLGLYLTWVIFTTIGALVGPLIGDVTHYGFDMAFVAVFLVLLKGMWKGVVAAIPWLVSLIVAVVSYLILPGAWYVLCGAIAGLIVAFIMAHYD